jgi:hypothetical protein
MAGAVAACQSAAYGPWPRRPVPGTQRQYTCRVAREAPILDGVLDDPVWAGAPWSEPFVALSGDEAAPCPRTWFKLLWDERHLYVAAVMLGDDVRGGSDLECYLDRQAIGSQWYELIANPAGAVRSAFVVRQGSERRITANACPTLDGAAEVQGSLDKPGDADTGWIVEMAIPWSCLKPPQASGVEPDSEDGTFPVIGDIWRMNFVRRDPTLVPPADTGAAPAPDDLWAWTPEWSAGTGNAEHWGRVQFTR